jgi:hypothetical protein
MGRRRPHPSPHDRRTGSDVFQPNWGDLACKVFVGSEREPAEAVTNSVVMSSLNAIEKTAHDSLGIVSVLTLAGMGDTIFKFLMHDGVDGIKPVVNYPPEAHIVHGYDADRTIPKFVLDVLRPGRLMISIWCAEFNVTTWLVNK